MTITTAPAEDMTAPAAPFPRVEIETWVEIDGFTMRIVLRDTSLSDVLAVLKKRGCTPVAPPSSGGQGGWTGGKGGKPRAERVNPSYNGQGDACCPTHQRPLKQGQWGLYCTAKDAATGEYCKLKFNE